MTRKDIQQPPPAEKATMFETMDTEEREDIPPQWCPEQQIYVGGIVPDSSSEVTSLLQGNNDTGGLRIFGYGSLCWNPGTTGALSKPGVTTAPGRARGYKRCWAQRSADHRGTTRFPGIVCTLLRDDEVRQIMDVDQNDEGNNATVVKDKGDKPTMTEGLIYSVPPELVDECLAELDFREKGGYARDVITVVEDETGKSVQALLYRGTPDNPAMWTRALRDLPFAAAIISVAEGPSGRNDAYLYNLDEFMRNAAASSEAAARALEDHTGDTVTGDLARMVKQLQKNCQLYFLFGSGSNQHNQLLLASEQNSARLVNGEDAHELKEIVVCTAKREQDDPKAIFAGGGHSGLLTDSGNLYLWGWNHHGQLGSSGSTAVNESDDTPTPLPVTAKLQGIQVEMAALGFSHTLVLEKVTGRLHAFGDNERGQVAAVGSVSSIHEPVTPDFVKEERFVDVAAGLFHSAAITRSGELIAFGCGRFGQCTTTTSSDSNPSKEGTSWRGRWQPPDGSRLVGVACGRRHTVLLDEHGRIWTVGDNKYGQLGRSIGNDNNKFDSTPRLVDGPLGVKGSSCTGISCGWSHSIARVQSEDNIGASIFGWGRNDRGQLGTGSRENIPSPMRLFADLDGNIRDATCGSESTVVIDELDAIYGCGWNEHGNLAIGQQSDEEDSLTVTPVVGARILAPPPADGSGKVLIAAGGAHLLAVRQY